MAYYVVYENKQGKRGETRYSNIESARRDAAQIKKDPWFRKVRVVTSTGKPVAAKRKPRKPRMMWDVGF